MDQNNPVEQESPGSERIHKALARAGHGSRRALERKIAEGRVRVNGHVAQQGCKVVPGDRIQIDGGRTFQIKPAVSGVRVLAYNKPAGVVCTRKDPEKRPNVFQHLPRLTNGRWINIGRLDINTSGLLLFTTHGELAHRLMHPSYRVDREYAARVYGRVTEDALQRLRDGVTIDGEEHRFDDLVAGRGEGSNQWYYCLLQRGQNREVRRLWEAVGAQVSRLSRVRFANVMLPTDLRAGRFVELGGTLLEELCNLVGLEQRSGKEKRPVHF